jgi:hypothetical protein
MPFAETSLQEEFAAAAEWMAGRALGALNGAEGGGLLVEAAPGGPRPPAALAALRALGPDAFAPSLFTGEPMAPATAAAVAEACRAFRPAGDAAIAAGGVNRGPADDDALVVGWRDWATARLLAKTGHGIPVPRPGTVPAVGPSGWQAWSVRMAQLCGLALPGLDSPVHDLARRQTLALARGATRSILRKDIRVAVRLARWLAWLQGTGTPVPVAVEPVLNHIRLTGDGGPRTALDLAIAGRLLTAGKSR